MISLRYHIVSLVAVFLALALGIVVGSTVLQEDGLGPARHQQQVRQQSERNSRENVALKQEISRLQSFGTTVLPELVQDRLKGRSVVLVDTDKVDSGMRDAVRKVLEDAGAEVDGQITFADERLALGAEADRTALARLLAVEDGGTAEALRGELVNKLAARLATSTALPQEDARRTSTCHRPPGRRLPRRPEAVPAPGLRDRPVPPPGPHCSSCSARPRPPPRRWPRTPSSSPWPTRSRPRPAARWPGARRPPSPSRPPGSAPCATTRRSAAGSPASTRSTPSTASSPWSRPSRTASSGPRGPVRHQGRRLRLSRGGPRPVSAGDVLALMPAER